MVKIDHRFDYQIGGLSKRLSLLLGSARRRADKPTMTHVWHGAYYSKEPAIWTFANEGDETNAIEWLRIRALHHPEQIECKISYFGDIMDVDAKGGTSHSTPLHAAVVNHHLGIAQRLIEAGADLSSLNDQGDTPLIELLVGVEARDLDLLDIEEKEENDAILAMMKLLLQSGVNVNRACTDTTELEIDGIYGYTALFHAIVTFPLGVPMLLEYGADVNARRSIDFARDTPLFAAVISDEDVCVQLLFEYGADVYAQDSEGSSVVEYLGKDQHGHHTPFTENSPASERVMQLIMAELQRKQVERQDKCVAFAMGKIERLGAMSRVFALDDELVRMIYDSYRL